LQRIVVFEQGGSADAKILGIRERGRDLRIERVVSIEACLPEVVDEAEDYLPDRLDADLVLDFLRHPDITQALALRCRDLGIPVVASGRRLQIEGLMCPPT